MIMECFATWCPPCRAQIPHMAKIAETFPNVYLIAISANETADVVNRLALKLPLMKKYNIATDPTGNVAEFLEENEVTSIPHCFIFDSAGKIVFSGSAANKEIDEILARLNEE